MKQTQRLDYARLAEVLHERRMADLESIRELLHQGGAFPEALVSTSLVADWDLSRVVCEIFSLPFLPVDLVDPDPAAREGIDKQFLIEHALIPMGRFGHVLTVCMPGMVPAEVLGMLAAQTDLVLLPVVGTVQSNRRWIEENIGRAARAEAVAGHGPSGWGDMFDSANEAVMMDLQRATSEDLAEAEALEFEVDPDDDAGASDPEPPSLSEVEVDLDLDLDAVQLEITHDDEPADAGSGSGLDLPPAPNFSG